VSDSDQNDPPYRVGYRKPPLATRFQKGHKGRPRGKAKVRKSLAADLIEKLNEKTFAKDGKGRRRKLSFMEFMNISVRNRAASGNAKAYDQICRIMAKVERTSSPSLLQLAEEKPRRNLEQIMLDFAQDMHEETYQTMCDIEGKMHTSSNNGQSVFDFIKEDYFKNKYKYDTHLNGYSFKIFIFMLASMQIYAKSKGYDIPQLKRDE
jgi:Family of unknown function (DUF5681)